LLLFSFFFSTSWSQPNYQFTTYTQENGLPSGTIREIKKDKSGFLWLLSENGLTRFDGYTFKKFYHNPNDSGSLSSIDVKDMHVSGTGKILFQTANELAFYEPSTFSFKKVMSLSGENQVTSVLAADNGFLVLKKGGIIYLDSLFKVSTMYPFPLGFNAGAQRLSFIAKNKLLLSNGQAVLVFDTKSKRSAFSKINLMGNSKITSDFRILIIHNGPQNTPYFFSNIGLFKYDLSTNTFNQQSFTGLKLDKKNFINGITSTGDYLVLSYLENLLFTINLTTGAEIFIDLRKSTSSPNSIFRISNLSLKTANSIWIGSSTSGVYEVQLGNSTVQRIGDSNNLKYQLPTGNIDRILDDGNVVWLVSSEIGLIKSELLHKLFETYRPLEQTKTENFSLANNIRTIFELDKNRLLIGGLEGLFLFNRSTKEFNPFYPNKSTQALLEKIAISKIIKDKEGNIWISVWGQNGIYVLSKDLNRLRIINPLESQKSIDYKSIRSIFIDSRNNLWVGTDNNLILRTDLNTFNINNDKGINFKIINAASEQNTDLNFAICFAFNETKRGDILIGTQNGFYEYHFSDNSFKRYVNQATNIKSISSHDVRAIYVDKNDFIWLATNGGGLNSFDQNTKNFEAYTTINGMPDNSVYSILEDNIGNLWMGTNKGLCAFDKAQKTIRSYFLKDGIQNYEFNTNAACKTLKGELVFGGINGFNIFNPIALTIDLAPPKVVITEFKVYDKERIYDGRNLNLDASENFVSFQFAAMNYYRNSENNYAYKLEGINNDWINCGDRRFTNYANLPPGNYTFRVKASNSFGVWSKQDALLKFSIATPWYNTWAFYTLIVLALSGIIYFIYHYRLQQAIQLQTVRNSIARDLHDEIGSNLSSISLFTEVAKEKNLSTEKNVSVLLQKISDYTQTSQEAMNDIVWMINTRNDRFENIVVRMRGLAVELLEAKNINLHLNFDERLNQIKLGMNERKNFYLIYKEALNNIVKYANCSNVWIDLKLSSNRIHLKIKDDGKGFDLTNTSGGNGFINMKKRAQVLNGEINLTSATGEGAKLELLFAL
jgi:signal transduction histidine kinase/ligand-binding sensor domain-containing protein